MPSVYELKPRFQALLRPAVARLAAAGVTANQVTVGACAASVAIGLALTLAWDDERVWLIVPVWLLARMGLNAIDGMLAREFGQKSRLGGYLNELTDVVSDAALYLPFGMAGPFSGLWIGVVIWLAAMSEMAGVLGRVRRHDGPMGKSDRAVVFGAAGLWMGLGGGVSAGVGLWGPRVVAALLAWTVVNRLRGGLRETA